MNNFTVWYLDYLPYFFGVGGAVVVIVWLLDL